MLEIRLFGSPTIHYNGQPLEIQRKVTRALLYYLAATGQPVGRARLATFFWPDLPEGKSRGRLRDQLGKLRDALPDPSLLQTTPQSVCLDFERIFVDRLTFQKLQKQISHIAWMLPPSATLPLAVYNVLIELAEMWNEPGFIAGVDLFDSDEADEWLTYTRHRLESEYLAVIQRLFHYERTTGKMQSAVHWLHKALQVDPLNEDINLLLLKTYLEDGQQAEARKHLIYYQKVTGQNLDEQLPAEILELKETIFGDTQEISPQEGHYWPLRPSFYVPYVGQEQILSQIEALYKKGGAVIVYGEAGAGKTRLAQEIHNLIQPHPKLLLASCYSNKMDIPFHPWIELLRNHVTQDDWLEFPPDWATMLKMVIPELASLRQDLQPVPDVITARIRQELFEVLNQVLQFLSKVNPIMLFLDDVHWADESSCEFLHYLLVHSFFRNPNRILLMTARIEEPNSGLTKFLPALPGRNLEQVHLAQLTASQVSDLASYVFGSTPSQEFIERVTRDSGGNPFFILETFQAILDLPEKISLQEAASLPLSNNVQQLIQYRLQRLSPRAQEILQIAAILGNRFDVATVELASAYSRDHFVPAMEELQAARLIDEVQAGKKLKYAFVHEKIRECLLQELPSLRSRLLHHKAARALEDSQQGKTDEIAITLAQHYEEAGEFSRAFDFWVQGASHAYQITSIIESLNAFNRARRLIPEAHNLEDVQLYELYKKWSGIAFNLDDPQQIENLNRELLAFGQERHSDLLIGTALNGLSDCCFASNQFESGLDFVVEALPYLERAGNLYELLSAQNHYGALLYMLGKFRESRDVLYAMRDHLPANQDTKLRNLNSNLHYQLGMLESLMGYPVKSLELLDHALGHRQRAPAPTEIMSIYVAKGLAYYLKSDFKSGRAVCAEAIEMGEQMQYKRMLGYAYAYSSLNLYYLGSLDEAWNHANQALYIGRTYSHHEISALGYRTMGNIHLRLEDYEPAIEYFRRGLQIAGEHFVSLDLTAFLGYTLAMTGRTAEGLDYLKKAYQVSSELKLGSISVFTRSLLIYVQCQKTDLDNAMLEEIELALTDARSRSIGRAAAILKAPFARVSQRPEMYLKQLNESLQDAARMSDPFFESNILKSLISFKKSQEIPCQADAEKLNTILDEFAPRAQGMPFESAWQKYSESMRTVK